MRKNTLTGNIKRHRAFHSRMLGNRRDVLVYLPPGYRRFSTKRYPVLYLHDGQNVFDAATSFAGVEWGVDETAQRLIHRNNRTERSPQETQPRLGPHLRAIFDRRIEAVHRQKISNEARCRIYRAGRIIARRFGHTGDRNFLLRSIHTFNCDVAIDLVGRLRNLPAGGDPG